MGFSLDAVSLSFDDGVGLVLSCGPEFHGPEFHGPEPTVPQPRALSVLGRAPSALRKKPPSALFKSETDVKANEKVTLCNNFAQLSLESQQRSAQTRTSSPERQ